MRSKSLINVSLFFALLTCNFVISYPDGAGGCSGGVPAVGGSHLTAKTIVSRTLSKKRVKVSVGGITMAVGRTVVVPYGKSLNIRVSGPTMKGILIRLRAPYGVSTTDVLIPRPGLKRALVCKSPAVGVSHVNNTEVNVYQSVVRFMQPTPNVALDITIVYENENEGDNNGEVESESEYAYGRIRLNFTQAP